MQGIGVNDDTSLEREADVMGAKSKGFMQLKINSSFCKDRISSKVIQRNSDKVKSFAEKMSKTWFKKQLILYSHICADGLGDAGQLFFLKSLFEKEEMKKKYKISKVKTIASYSIDSKGSSTEVDLNEIKEDKDKREGLINKILGINQSNIKYVDGFSAKRDVFKVKGWEIEYPFPDSKYRPSDKKILKIGEMRDNGDFIRTGESGIGYGIPRIEKTQVAPGTTETTETIGDRIMNPSRGSLSAKAIEELRIINNNAWLVSFKSYTNGTCPDGLTSDYRTKLIGLAKGQTNLLIIAGNPMVNYFDGGLLVIQSWFDSDLLNEIICSITNGMIISGGEGLFVQSMGAPNETNDAASNSQIPNETATVLAGRYQFQYKEIAKSLLREGTPNTVTIYNKIALISCFDRYGILIMPSLYSTPFILDTSGENMISLDIGMGGRFSEGIELSKLFEEKGSIDIRWHRNLSALYFPLSLNAYDISMPTIFTNFDDVKSIFLEEKKRFKNGNWFDIFTK